MRLRNVFTFKQRPLRTIRLNIFTKNLIPEDIKKYLIATLIWLFKEEEPREFPMWESSKLSKSFIATFPLQALSVLQQELSLL